VSSSPAAYGHKATALIADDELSNRIILKTLLRKIGYDVIEAENGYEAIKLFNSTTPNIVFMDIMMPEMDGFEAVSRIRASSPERFVPVIFLTAVTDEQSLVRAIDVGGDDFITKPFNHEVLKAKIRAMERIGRLHQQVSAMYDRMHQDETVAEKVFTGAVVADNVALDTLGTLLQPAGLFSGDVLLTAYSPSRDLNILLGDFTGHGLAAALGALPTSEVFRAMTNKGFSPSQILTGINRKLLSLMPTGMFFAAQFVSVSKSLTHVSVCNCGMPDILFLSGEDSSIKHRANSLGLPLGITGDMRFPEIIEHVKIEQGDRIMLVSDGVTEAVNPYNEQFGLSRFEQAITQHESTLSALDSVSAGLEAFCLDAEQADDISLVEVPCIPELLPDFDTKLFSASASEKGARIPTCDVLEFTLTLRGHRLRDADPVPLIINHIQELEGINGHRRLLFTILTELYVNALDHGVLQLKSSLKSSADGFSRYFDEREKRLQELDSGHIQICVQTHPLENGGEVLIQIEDSGPGFDFKSYDASENEQLLPSGRGIRLVQELCDSLTFQEPGNRVDAVYSWVND
jgi:CheY-like chemotaxis protein